MFNLPILYFLYSFFSGLHVVFFHESVHGGQFDLAAEIRVYAAVSYSSILKFLGRVTKLRQRKDEHKPQTSCRELKVIP